MKFQKNYEKSERVQVINNLPSMVKPEFELELEINNIMDRYIRTGYMPPENIPGIFGDFSLPQDFGAMQDKVLAARAAFIDLPIEIRDHYRTAESLINALSDPHEKTRLTAFGVLEKEQEPIVAPVAGSGVQPQVAPDKGAAS